MAEVEFAAGEMCVSLKATMGMPAPNGEESAMVALFLLECVMEVSMTNFFVPCVSHDGGILDPTVLIC